MTLKTLLTGTALAIGFTVPVAGSATQLDWSQLGIQMPQPGAQSMCDTAPQDQAFASFQCPLINEAAWYADPSMLHGRSRAEQFAYLNAWITAVHDPSVVWKVDPSVYSQLDARLPMHMRYLIAKNPDVLGGVAGERLNILGQAFGNFLDVRKHATETNQVLPMQEMMAILGGVADAPKPITLATEIATHDVMAWIGIAQQDPDAAIQIYTGMRHIAINF